MSHFVVKDNITYMACKECWKKVYRDISLGDWRCDRCNKTYEEADATYMLLVKIADSTDFMFVNIYSDQAQQLLDGFPAEECHALMDQGNRKQVEERLEEFTQKRFWITVKAKVNEFNEETKIKYTGEKIFPNVSWAMKNVELLKKLKTFKA